MPTHFSLISVLGVRWEKQETCIYLGSVKQSLLHRVISQAFLAKPVIWCCPIKLGFSCCFSISINNSQNFCSLSFGGIIIIKVWSSGGHQRGESRRWSSMGCGINKIKQNFVLLSLWHSRYERNINRSGQYVLFCFPLLKQIRLFQYILYKFVREWSIHFKILISCKLRNILQLSSGR